MLRLGGVLVVLRRISLGVLGRVWRRSTGARAQTTLDRQDPASPAAKRRYIYPLW